MTITVIKQIGSAQLATELEEQPKLTAETLRDIALDLDETSELANWVADVAAASSVEASRVVRALAAAFADEERVFVAKPIGTGDAP